MLALFGIAVLAVGMLPLLWALSRSPRRVSSVHLVPASAGLLFALPPLVYVAIAQRDLGSTIRAPSEHVWSGLGAIAVFVGATSVTVFALRKSRLSGVSGVRELSNLRSVGLRRILPVALFVWGVRLIAAVNYGWFYAGSYDPGATPYGLFAAKQIAEALAVGVIVWSTWSVGERATTGRKTIATMLLVVEAVYVFPQGRREMFFFVVLVGVVYLYSYGRARWKEIALGLIGLSVLAFAAFPLYQATRHALAARFGGQGTVGVSGYYSTVAVASQRTDAKELYLSNLKRRLASYYRWQVEIASLRDQAGSLNGRLAYAGLLNSVPRFLVAEKGDLKWGEELLRGYYGEDLDDRPNSLVAAGFADFGMPGAAMYGIFFVLLVWAATNFGAWVAKRSPILGAAVIGGVMLLALRTEITMVGVFSSLRNIVFLGLFAVGWAVTVRSYRRRVFGSVPSC